MAAIFNFESLLVVIFLFICTCTYMRLCIPGFIVPKVNSNGYDPGKKRKRGELITNSSRRFMGLLWKLSRIGERASPFVSLVCVALAISTLFYSSSSASIPATTFA
jgi:Protein of unknown function (DUF1242)